MNNAIELTKTNLSLYLKVIQYLLLAIVPSMAGFNGFSFPNNSSSPSPFSSGSSSINQTNDEATIKKILEAIEILEKLAKDGAFPQQKLEEIKKELEKKYPNIFSTQSNSQNQGNNNSSSNSSTIPNFFPNNSPFPNSYPTFSPNLFNEQEFYKKIHRSSTTTNDV